MAVKCYKDLIAWQKAVDLVELIYRATEHFPRREIFGLANQMRRAAVSVPSNVAEGQGRSSTRDFLHFLAIATGSLQELETQVLIVARLQYLAPETVRGLMEASTEVARIISGLRTSLCAK
jgi:four helix bundle protein